MDNQNFFWATKINDLPVQRTSSFIFLLQMLLLEYHHFDINMGCSFPASVPAKAVCREIGSALWKIGSTNFVRMSKKDAFSWLFSQT